MQQEPAQVVYKGGNEYNVAVANKFEQQIAREQAPALVVAKRQSPDRIYVTDNFSAKPVQTEEEFRRVVDSLKKQSAKSETPITVVAIPVAKPVAVVKTEVESAETEIVEYGARGLAAIVPTAKPSAPKWFAQKAEKVNVTEGFIWPIRGKIVSTYGEKQNGIYNDGINIAAPLGKEVKAAADGEVVYAGNELEGYGNMLILRHNNGWMSAYAHTHKMHVGLGTKVNQGQLIAEIGNSGDVQSPQLHFGLRKDKQAVNPMDFLTDSYAANY